MNEMNEEEYEFSATALHDFSLYDSRNSTSNLKFRRNWYDMMLEHIRIRIGFQEGKK